MNSELYQKFPLLQHHQSLTNIGSFKSARRPKPLITLAPDYSEKQIFKNKTNSPKGWKNWSYKSSNLEEPQSVNSIRLPPLSLEVKTSALSEINTEKLQKLKTQLFEHPGPSEFSEDQILRPRGSMIFEEFKTKKPFDPTKIIKEPLSLYKKGSIILEDTQNSGSGLENWNRKKTFKEDFLNVVTRCGFKTAKGSVLGKPKKHNQDNWVISQKIQGIKGQYIFAVCDGHGDKGHKVSKMIHQHLCSSIEEKLSSTSPPNIQTLEESISSGIKKTVEIIENSDLDLKYSGSTLLTVFIQGKSLICGNIGDSRAVVGSIAENNKWTAIELSSDQKPCRQDEAKRVSKAGGIIRQFVSGTGNSVGPLRVWGTEKSIPGLAMTRSIGDTISKKKGIISDPEITTKVLNPHDKFLILATDGIWECISSEEAVNVVKDVWAMGKSELCCEKLMDLAKERWEKENVVDDITVIVAFFNVR